MYSVVTPADLTYNRIIYTGVTGIFWKGVDLRAGGLRMPEAQAILDMFP